MSWAHTYTDNENVLNSTCQNCHGVNNTAVFKSTSAAAEWTSVPFGTADDPAGFLSHASSRLASRQMLDKAEILVQGHVTGLKDDGTLDNAPGGQIDTLCSNCHAGMENEYADGDAKCGNDEWIKHLTQGRVAESVWEEVSKTFNAGSTCGW